MPIAGPDYDLRPGASGTAVFALGQAQLRVAGQVQVVPPPPPASVQIQAPPSDPAQPRP